MIVWEHIFTYISWWNPSISMSFQHLSFQSRKWDIWNMALVQYSFWVMAIIVLVIMIVKAKSVRTCIKACFVRLSVEGMGHRNRIGSNYNLKDIDLSLWYCNWQEAWVHGKLWWQIECFQFCACNFNPDCNTFIHIRLLHITSRMKFYTWPY